MKQRTTPLDARETERWNYFVAEVPDMDAHGFRLPREEVAARLLTVIANRSNEWTRTADDFRGQILEEAAGAMIGICWRHATVELETPAPLMTADDGALLRYGGAVMQELYDGGYKASHRQALIDTVISRILTHPDLIPAEEVADRVGFSSATGQDGDDSSASTSA